MMQVSSANLLKQEIALWKSRQPLLRKPLRLFFLTFRSLDRCQLFSSAKIVWSRMIGFQQVRLCFFKIFSASQKLRQSQSGRRAERRQPCSGFIGFSRLVPLAKSVVGNPEVIGNSSVRRVAGVDRLEKGLGLFETQQSGRQASGRPTPLNAIRKLGESVV